MQDLRVDIGLLYPIWYKTGQVALIYTRKGVKLIIFIKIIPDKMQILDFLFYICTNFATLRVKEELKFLKCADGFYN